MIGAIDEAKKKAATSLKTKKQNDQKTTDTTSSDSIETPALETLKSEVTDDTNNDAS